MFGVLAKQMLRPMNSASSKFSNILVNSGGRRKVSHPAGDRRGKRSELTLSPIQSALMGTIGRPWA